MKRKIRAKFIIGKGTWSNATSRFIIKTKITQYKDIEMEITNGKLIFHGGPTGYERYYIEDLLSSNLEGRDRFCICAGTLNRWAKCTVPWKDVYEFITKENNNVD